VKITRRDDALRAGADEVARVLVENGHRAFFAGGCVRDLVLGHAPKDYDIATDAHPDRVLRLFRRTVMVGAAFGVVRVIIDHGKEYEIATFRTEGVYADGRRPEEVAYTDSEKEDVERRDFTINALLLDPRDDEVIDHVGGLADLHAGLIRAVGDPVLRFAEDKLRMLRAVRFVARFGFDVEPRTLEAIHQHATDLGQVSVERIVMELQAIWASARPGLGMRLLASTGLLNVAISSLTSADVEPLASRFDRLVGVADPALVGWALIIDAVEPADPEAMLRDAKLSRERMRAALEIVRARPILHHAETASLADRARVLISPLADVMRGYVLARLGPTSASLAALDALAKDHALSPLPALPLIGGAELKALGFAPGPRFKDVLAAVETEVLERRVTTREEALALARSML